MNENHDELGRFASGSGISNADVEKQAKELIAKHLGPEWKFAWQRGNRKSGATAWQDEKMIQMNPSDFEGAQPEEIKDVILHEIGHGLYGQTPEGIEHRKTYKGVGATNKEGWNRMHNPGWQKTTEGIGGSADPMMPMWLTHKGAAWEMHNEAISKASVKFEARVGVPADFLNRRIYAEEFETHYGIAVKELEEHPKYKNTEQRTYDVFSKMRIRAGAGVGHENVYNKYKKLQKAGYVPIGKPEQPKNWWEANIVKVPKNVKHGVEGKFLLP